MPVSNVCEVDWIWYPCSAPQTEICVEFPFNQIRKSALTFSTSQSWHIIKSWYRAGDQKKDIGTVSQVDLTEFSFACDAG